MIDLVATVRKIRACEGEAAAQLLLEYVLMEHVNRHTILQGLLLEARTALADQYRDAKLRLELVARINARLPP